MKKGQMEMVGLAVIVIILIVVFVLFVNLNRGKDVTTIKSRESLYANNLLNSVMLYSLDKGSVSYYIDKCEEYTDLLRLNSDDEIELKKREYCGIRSVISGLMSYPLLRQNQKYELLFNGDCGDLDKVQSPVGCGEDFITASPYYIRTSGTCKIKLRLC